MKIFLLILIGLYSTSTFNLIKTTPPVDVYKLEGVWNLQYQLLYDNNQVSDTIFNTNGYRQVKMYSKGKVMWTRFDPADNNEWFGYGSYSIKGNMLEERLEYASGSMMKIVDTTQVFKFELVMDKNSYQQIAVDKKGQYSLSEHYIKIE